MQNIKKIDHSLFVAGEDVMVEADVVGDVFCAGKTVTINGTVDGDVLCAAQTVRINGEVRGNVRIVAMDVSLAGTVGGNASIVAQSLAVDSKARVAKDLTAISSTATLNGKVERDIVIVAQEAQLNGTTTRDVTATIESLSVGKDANITGKLHYYSENEASIAAGAQVPRSMRHDPPEAKAETEHPQLGEVVLDGVMTTVMILIIGLVVAGLFPRMLQNLTAHARQKPGTVALTGGIALFVGPITVLLTLLTGVGLLLTGVGLLLSGIVFFSLLVIVLVSAPLFGHFMGSYVLKTKPSLHPVLVTLTGLVLLCVAFAIPIVTIFAYLATFIYGLGAVITAVMRYNTRPDVAVSAAKVVTKKA